ncbi:hypothetical protein BC829DRAFT_190828 [Chytridium lagenaria]|nr:hypothetical protein BC829DRAFT_190828 [Chytridium lagenaria]
MSPIGGKRSRRNAYSDSISTICSRAFSLLVLLTKPSNTIDRHKLLPRINLSYLHRSTLLAQARSLTHLGVICQYYGLDDNAFQCHYHASALLSYYGSRSPSFTAVDKDKDKSGSTGPNRPWYTMKLDLYEGGIAVNLASALHAKGRIPAALDRLNRALRLFNTNNDNVGKMRALANASALKIEVGKVVGNLHWLRNMDTQARGAGEVDECKRYWVLQG